MKLIIGILILLASIPLTFATTTEVLTQGWFSYDDSFSADGSTFTLRGANTHVDLDDNESVFVVFRRDGASGVHVFQGECEEVAGIEYCFESRSFSQSQIDIDAQGKLQPALYVTLTKQTETTSADVSRVLERNIFQFGETSSVEIIVRNTGTTMLQVSLTEPVPEGYEIVSKSNAFSQENNVLSSSFGLRAGNEWRESYTIRANTFDEVSYQTVVSYESINVDQTEKKTSIANQAVLRVERPFSLTSTVNPASMENGEFTTLTVTIANTDDEDFTLENLNITIPNQLTAVRSEGVTKESNRIYSEEDVLFEAGDEESFSVTGRLDHVGEFDFSFAGVIQGQTLEYPFSGEQVVTTTSKGISCTVVNTTRAVANTALSLDIILQNNDNENMRSIQGSSSTNQFYQLEVLRSGAEQVLTSETLQLPFSLKEENLAYEFSGSYVNIAGQSFPVTCSLELTIAPGERLFDAEINYETTETNRNTSFSFELELSNAPINIDEINIEVLGQERLVTLQANETKTERFTVIIPEFIESETLDESIKLSTPEGYVEDLLLNVTILDPYDWEESFEELEKESQVIIGTKSAEEDTSFIGQLKALWRSIFG